MKKRKEVIVEERFKTIEDHAQNLGVRKSELAAVMQMQRWSAGKKVLEMEFKAAVNVFLTAPMGGEK